MDADAEKKLVVCGAGGRDFHDFNVALRDDPAWRVVAFTAAQIPGIDDRRYPAALAGPRYPDGIPIVPEAELESVCRAQGVNAVLFAYSDVSHGELMALGSRALATGADFLLFGPDRTMLAAARPVIAVSAVRTGCGKSQVARYLAQALRERGLRVAVLRHPMPYGDLSRQRVQRFATAADLDAADCTLEEREEYEPHLAAGGVLFAGVDYAAVAAVAAAEADVIVWDGGNNDFPFLRPDLHIVVADALRPDHVTGYYPGEAVLRTADVVVLNKVDAAGGAATAALDRQLAAMLPGVPRVAAASPVALDDPARVMGRRVLVVDDGPTLTHGGMPHGAGFAAVRDLPGVTLVDPRASAPPALQAVYRRFPHLGPVLPALGYSAAQRADLQATIDASAAEVVVAGTPIDFARAVPVSLPVIRARYRYQDAGTPGLLTYVDDFLRRRGLI